jgi:multidrug efflux pump subunit AcrB
MVRIFIDRPVLAIVIALVMTIAGAVAGLSLPIAQFPQITLPTIRVSAAYPGANAEVVERAVSQAIEKQVNGVEGMLYMSSQSTASGALQLTVTFKVGTDIDKAQVQVQKQRLDPAVDFLVQVMNQRQIILVEVLTPWDQMVRMWYLHCNLQTKALSYLGKMN